MRTKHVAFRSLPSATHTTLTTRVEGKRKAVVRVYSDGLMVVACYSRGLYKSRSRVANWEEAESVMRDWLKGI